MTIKQNVWIVSQNSTRSHNRKRKAIQIGGQGWRMTIYELFMGNFKPEVKRRNQASRIAL